MKITQSIITKLEISDVPGLDPVRAYIDDIEPGHGRLTVECWGSSWSTYFGGLPEGSDLSDFVISHDSHYIANRMMVSGESDYEVDSDAYIAKLRKEVISKRRMHEFSQDEARDAFESIGNMEFTENIGQLHAHEIQLVEELMGDEWWRALPTRTTARYNYLHRIVEAVQAGLKELQEKRPAHAI